ncbi:MAG: hypothetical protein IKL24_00675 [Clostridia bacterium]|nr:hypothetical protein [Clostridia bacterium]
MKKHNDSLRLGLVALGAVFLFNPTINIVDLLPDFIGFWLIAKGLTYTAYVSETVAMAKKSIVYLAFIEAAKLLSCALLVGGNGTNVVLLTFCFTVVEAILFIPAVDKLFEGLASLGVRHAGKAVFSVPLSSYRIKKAEVLTEKLNALPEEYKKECNEKARKNISKKAKRLSRRINRIKTEKTVDALKLFTIIAFLIRALGAIIPVLPNLMMYGDTLFVSAAELARANLTQVLSYLIAWTAGLIVGIKWLLDFRRYINGIILDTGYTDTIYKKCEAEVLCDKGRLCADMMKKVLIILCTAAVSTFVFPVDFINVTPNLITAGLFIAVFIYLFDYSKKLAIAGMASSLVWAVFSAIGICLQYNFRENHYRPSIVVGGPAYAQKLYLEMEIFSYIEAGLFLISAFIIARVFLTSVRAQIKMMPPRQDGLPRNEKKLLACLKPVAYSGGVVILFNCVLTFVTKWIQSAWIINGIAVITLTVFAIRAYYSLWDNVYVPMKRKF